ncbi:hypothetical protein LMG33818_002635 [Halomonadaceae bacterium LMG 33818]|uniref:phage portal protein n=1 Tax=Cernens ardua TaxID=3402176 RepID=UPI003EDC3009
MSTETASTNGAQIKSFTFGEPVPVLNAYDVVYTGILSMGDTYFELPVDFFALSRLYRATPHHGSALQIKRNLLKKYFIPHPLLSRQQFEALVQDFLIFGNCYLETTRSKLGSILSINPAPARYVRRGADLVTYYWLNPLMMDPIPFPAGSVAHLMQPDIDQEVYGVPDYMGILQSVMLNEAATLFRRRYYENGSHAGFILYVTGEEQNTEDIDAIRQALRDSKGVGNFRNLFLHVPKGQKDGVQLIPVSDVKASDDFAALKGTSRDDQLAGHRVPPQLLGIVPTNNGGFGSISVAAQVFIENEIAPIMESLTELNTMIGEEVIRFLPLPTPQPTPPSPQPAAS